MTVDMNAKDCDSEWYDLGEMTLNVIKRRENGDSKRLNGYVQWLEMPKLRKRDDPRCMNEYETWLWKPKLKKRNEPESLKECA